MMTATTTTPPATAAPSSTPLALPSGASPRTASAAPLAAILGAVAGMMLIGALVSAYVGLKLDQVEWLPKGVEIDNYLGSMLALTVLLGSVIVEWAAFSARADKTAQAVIGFGFTAMLGAAAGNLGWYTVNQIQISTDTHPYAVVVTALLGIAVVLTAAVTWLALLTAFRSASRQLVRASGQARATAWLWHLIALTWVAVWATVFIYR